MDLTNQTAVFTIGVMIAISAQVLSARMRMPPIFLWLLAGMILGPFGFHLLHIESIAPALHTLIELGLAIIMFEGGLNLNIKAITKHRRMISCLVFLGPLFGIILGGTLVHLLVDITWPLAFLFGALVSIGGPTVVQPIVKQIRLDRDLRHILIGESMLVEAMGAIVAIVMLQFVLHPNPNLSMLLSDTAYTFTVGAIVGLVGGWILIRALGSSWFLDGELRTITSLGFVWFIFIIADGISPQAGLLAVLVTGMMMQKADLPDILRLKHFKASLATLLISVLFVLLAANLNLNILIDYLWQGVVLFIFLAVVVRPLLVWISTIGSGLSVNQRWFLACMAPRGVVVAALASLFVIILLDAGHENTEVIQALLYIIIILSVLVYGIIAGWLNRYLHVDGGDDHSMLIVGGGQIGAELGRVFQQEHEVRFVDLNAEMVKSLKEAGHTAVCGNALDPFSMELIHAEEVTTALIMTGSADHNLLIARMIYDEFHVRNLYVTLQDGDSQKHERMIRQLNLKRLFAKPYHFTYWNDQAFRKRLVYDLLHIEANSNLINKRLEDITISHGVQVLMVMRQHKMFISHNDLTLEEDDEIWLLLRPERLEKGQILLQPKA
ncbi:MAG: cation:proton antiporter [Mariprofundaceae bacterium]|nr:cation:proton antiporter [Mariprofundaceae bacterium]